LDEFELKKKTAKLFEWGRIEGRVRDAVRLCLTHEALFHKSIDEKNF
jgi:hypothetical protein